MGHRWRRMSGPSREPQRAGRVESRDHRSIFPAVAADRGSSPPFLPRHGWRPAPAADDFAAAEWRPRLAIAHPLGGAEGGGLMAAIRHRRLPRPSADTVPNGRAGLDIRLFSLATAVP